MKLNHKEVSEIGKWIKSLNDLGQNTESIAAELVARFKLDKDEAADIVMLWKGFNGIEFDESRPPSVFGEFLEKL